MAVGDAEQLTVTARAHGRRIFAVLAAVLGGSGCNDPVGPDITSPSGAKLTVDVLIPGRFASDPERTAHVSAWLTPGREKNGSLREVEAPLRVSGKPIPLVAPSGSDWATTQNVVVPLTPIDGFATFAIAVPVITGVQPTIPVTSVHTMRLAEPDTVRVGGDGSLRLHPPNGSSRVRNVAVARGGRADRLAVRLARSASFRFSHDRRTRSPLRRPLRLL